MRVLVAQDDYVATHRDSSGALVAVVTRAAAHSAATAVWIKGGSRHETSGTRGAAHLLEHLLMRGTQNRSGDEITKWIDSTGGRLAPFTTRESTVVLAKVPATEWEISLEVVSDLAFSPSLAPDSVQREVDVVHEELRGLSARQDQVAFDELHRSLFGKSGLANDVIGTHADLDALTPRRVGDYHRTHYLNPENVALLVVGPPKLSEVQQELDLATYFSNSAPRSKCNANRTHDISGAGRRTILGGGFSGSYVGMATLAPGRFSVDYWTWYAANALLGDGLSSRLVRSIRDERGWAYDVFSTYEAYSDCGLLMTFAAVPRSRVEQTVEEMGRVVRSLSSTPPDSNEVSRAIGRARGEISLRLDAPDSLLQQVGEAIEGFGTGGGEVRPVFPHDVREKDVVEAAVSIGNSRWDTVVVMAGQAAE